MYMTIHYYGGHLVVNSAYMLIEDQDKDLWHIPLELPTSYHFHQQLVYPHQTNPTGSYHYQLVTL